MTFSSITNPSAYIARGIENILLIGENREFDPITKLCCSIAARLTSITVFPIFLSMELTFKKIPQLLSSVCLCKDAEKNLKNLYKVQKYSLGVLCFPMGLLRADAVSGFFLKNPYKKDVVSPFGVAEQYGKAAKIHFPETIEDLKILVQQAKKQEKQISVIGSGMSQGLQTIPCKENDIVINTKKLQKIEFLNDNQSVKAEAGTTWEMIQVLANQLGKSVIVKQASDIFSIGGSIGINCHGWAHEYGAISSTVESLEIINDQAELQTLYPEDELFTCMFGTLGYFGIIVSATIKLTDNEYLIEKAEEIPIQQFIQYYENNIRGKKEIPLFGGRLTLDTLEGKPLRNVCMVSYEKDAETNQIPSLVRTQSFTFEPEFGTRLQRIALHTLSCLPEPLANRAISQFWSQERVAMLREKKCTRNEALHPPIKAFLKLNYSKLHAQWLQEYFIKEKNLANFLLFLGAELKANQIKLINASIRPVPKDPVSILPYAEQDRYAVVICFYQKKTEKAIERTKEWTKRVNDFAINNEDVYFQAYMPFTNKEEFEKCYHPETVQRLRLLKQKYDPQHVFGNAHTAKYFDA
ncbi:MAG: FAD-binding oxidoreductase [Chlamydiales bacterium]|jgi:FAD/FMN-containing dehydrogenase|nr:FAD-binding oxidoreductase [Chlamydiales bacterium]